MDMKQKLCLFLSSLAILLCSTAMMGQTPDVQTLPDDPRIRSGKLANGLTYYVVKNQAEKGYANFAIAQKVGTVVEKGNQKGMGKMLELLSVRGTRNFTDSTIVKYLNSLGVSSKDIIFETGADETVYTINHVPVTNQNTMDSTLLILYNWMASINIDEEDISRAMPMLRKSLAEQCDAQSRVDAQILAQLYPRSPYADAITPQQINKMKVFSSKELRNFYYNWFRPDLQAVFVVGDIDPAKVETQIKSIFATIPKPLKGEKRNYYKPKMVKGTEVVMGTDPEYDKTTVSISFQRVPLLAKYRKTSVPYIESYLDESVSALLLQRLQSGIVKQNLPISNVQIRRGKFMDMANLETFEISFETLPGAVYSALSFMSGEINRIARSGFNYQEFRNRRDIHYKQLETVYDNRFSQPNTLFMERVQDNYLRGYSLASIEMHFEIMKEILFSDQLRLEQLNKYATALLGQKEGVVISCRMPKVDGIEALSVERIQNTFLNSLAKSDYMASVDATVTWPKYISGDRQATIVTEVEDHAAGSTVFSLSNGVRAIFKRVEGSGDTISFKAVSKGGLSVERSSYARDLILYISDIANLSAIGGLPRSTWEKLYAYNNLSLEVSINDYMEQMYGYTAVESLEKFFHLINMSFTQRQDDYNSFDIYRKGKSSEALYRKLSPKKVFEDSVRYYNASNKRYLPAYSQTYAEQMDYYRIQSIIKKRLENPADFLFVFVGNAPVEQMREYIVKYLGSLPTTHDTEDWFVTPNYPAKGVVERRFLHQMMIPKSYVDVTISYGMTNTQRNRAMCGLLEEYLREMYANGAIRELSPQSSVNTSIELYPEEIMICRSEFETDSAGVQEILDIMASKLKGVVYNGISEEEFSRVKKKFQKEVVSAMERNGYWIDKFVDNYLLGKDMHSGYLAEIAGITSKDFQQFIDMVYRRGNHITVVMEGTVEDVNTQNLFRENQFIREFFDL